MARAKLIALIGEPKSPEAAMEIAKSLPTDAAIVTRSMVAFAAVASLGHPMRTLERNRSDDELKAAADEVVDLSKAPAQKATAQKPSAPVAASSSEQKD